MKKAQAAMEFLMTYGWAILVVLAAIGALAYFGVLSPGNLLPDKCTLSPGFDIIDCKASQPDGLLISLFNGLGVDTDSTVIYINTTGGSAIGCVELWDAGPLANGATTVTHPFCLANFSGSQEGQRFDGNIKVVYEKSGETLNHTVTGKIQIKVEK